MNEDQKNKHLTKKFYYPIFSLYFIATTCVFFIFPHELMGNTYVLIAYLILSLIFIYIFFKYKKSLN
ncbi:hypothetical protein BAA08_13080 [Bizionia sp. APA-3]|nr:hypothetical protein BAA08_13080 [Bizionia sp. APA-3]